MGGAPAGRLRAWGLAPPFPPAGRAPAAARFLAAPQLRPGPAAGRREVRRTVGPWLRALAALVGDGGGEAPRHESPAPRRSDLDLGGARRRQAPGPAGVLRWTEP